jgi:UDP-N-acetylglucosamine 2-epimerase (non-hydrolysing)/GDP/UDP-N,N'-diacetylbacillosamine 2-epimerase (hydrolysing)
VVKQRTICVLTGTRAEYGLLKPVMRAIAAHPRLQLSLIVTGMHLDRRYGYTVNEIVRDGFVIDARVPMHMTADTGAAMANAVGHGIIGLTRALQKIAPDVLLVLGDRTEPLAGTIAAVYQGIPVAHIHGGDTSHGGLDESNRHAITKFAHVHFPATLKSAGRVRNLGEDPWRIHVTGAPGLDTILHTPLPSRNELEKKLRISLRPPVILLVQHPVTTEIRQAGQQMRETLAAIKSLGITTILGYPNSDAGSREIIKAIRAIEHLPYVHTCRNLAHTDYLGLLKNISVLAGNSSSGIIEAPLFKLPVVNIGSRQFGREKAGTVIDVGYDRRQIAAAICRALSPAFRKKLRNNQNPYGNGTAGKKIAAILAALKIDSRLLSKKMTY